MKYLLLVLLFSFSIMPSYAGKFKNKKEHVIVAFTYQPSWYNLYNKNDWNNVNNTPNSKFDYYSIPSNPKGFNAHTFGFSIELPFAKRLVVQMELLYGTQSQYHNISPIRTNYLDPDSKTLYRKDLKNTIQQLRIPFMLKYKWALGESNFYLSGMAGLQVSYTLDYHTEHKTYRTIKNRNSSGQVEYSIYSDSIKIYTSDTKYRSYQKLWDDNGVYLGENETGLSQYFHDITIGVLTGFEVSTTVLESMFLSIGGRFEYDFTNATTENGTFERPNPSIRNDNPLAISHNIRYGFTFSVGYVF